MVQYLLISGVGAGIGAMVSKNKKKGALIGAGVGVIIHFTSVLSSLGETYRFLQDRKDKKNGTTSNQTEDEASQTTS